MSEYLLSNPGGIQCEAMIPMKGAQMKIVCPSPATHIYGPECEATTGKLMYLCAQHARVIQEWVDGHPHDPVNCPTHGNIGKVKDYVILKKM